MEMQSAQAPPSRPKKILVMTAGSRGDFQPYVPTTAALQEAGYEVILATNKDFVPSAEKAGLKAVEVFPDAEAGMQAPKFQKAMADGDAMLFIEGMGEYWDEHREGVLVKWKALMDEFKPDLLITGTLCEIFAIIGERHYGIPTFNICLQYQPENPPKVLMGMPNFPCCCRRWFMRYLVRTGITDQIKSFGPTAKRLYGINVDDLWVLEDTYEMKFTPRFGIVCGMNARMAKQLYGDTPGIKYVGHLAVESEKQMDDAKKGGDFGDSAVVMACTEFFAAGRKPVYMGFGSMTCKSPEYMVTLLAKSAKQAGVRAIVFEGWAGLSLDVLRKATTDASLIEYARENVLFVGKTPHAWLFPQCSVIIHHGGAGSTHTSARSGTPQIITPVFFDQWDHARYLNEAGCGVGFEKVNLIKVQAEALGDAIKKILSTPSIQKKAQEWAENANSEPGAQGVVRFVEEFWTKHVVTGEYKRYVDERKKAISKGGR